MAAIEIIYLPGGDPSRVEVRLSADRVAAFQEAAAAAAAGQLTTTQADAVIATLQAYISAADTAAMKAGQPPSEILAEQKLDATDSAPLTLDAIASRNRPTRHEAATAIRLLTAAARGRVVHTDARDVPRSGGYCCDRHGLCTHTDSLDERNTMTRSADYEQGRRDAQAAGPLGPRQPPLHLAPLALSKQTQAETRAATRAHFDAEDAETRHYREQARLAEKGRVLRQREFLTGKLHFDAADAGRTCTACDMNFDEGDKCPGCGGDGTPAKPAEPKAAAPPTRARRAFDGGGGQPWKQPLQMSSGVPAKSPSEARSFSTYKGGDGPEAA